MSLSDQPDFKLIAKAIHFLQTHVETQPSLTQLAEELSISQSLLSRKFKHWAGVSPKRFLEYLTLEQAKKMLDDSHSVSETSYALGLSGGSRLHDHFVQLEAMSPGEYRKKGEQQTIVYGSAFSPFGQVMMAVTTRGICSLIFSAQDTLSVYLNELQSRWIHASFERDDEHIVQWSNRLFKVVKDIEKPIYLQVQGTNFQIQVWRALLSLAPAALTSYGELGARLGAPKAARAVGSALGANPVAFLIPCHRVIQQSGQLGGYAWGLDTKRAILAWEQCRKKNGVSKSMTPSS